MLSRFFINRPIAATVVSILIVIAGAASQLGLPVSKFPDITPPTVQVTAFYPGANPQVLAETVAAPIEQQVNGVEDMLYMSSMCADDGSYTLSVTFAIGTDMDMATVLVQNRVSIAEPQLPEEVRRQGITTQKQSTQIVQFIELTAESGEYDDLFLSNYITIDVRDALSRIEGVGAVNVMGADQYSMRIWLDPEQLKSRNLTTQDVVDAIRQQNVQVAAGRLGEPPAPEGTPFQLVVNTKGRLTYTEEFGDIIVKTAPGNRVTRVKDVARVELGGKTYNRVSTFDGIPSAAVAIYQLPGANALDVADKVTATMEKLSKDFPEGIKYSIPFDTTRFVTASVDEVYKTLYIAIALVVAVIFIFLQDWRATLIPCVAIPVSLVGTFAMMAALGFSINMLTLFGIVLAIGIVVDDAIVVVENASRHLEKGLSPRAAAIEAMQEITGPIIATTMVLLAVFLPTAFMGGITGQLYRQFALTISGSVLISMVNALTFSPAMCAVLMKPKGELDKAGRRPQPLPPLALAVAGGVLAAVLLEKLAVTFTGLGAGTNGTTDYAILWGLRVGLFVGGALVGWLVALPINRVLDVLFAGFNRVFNGVTTAYDFVIRRLVRLVTLVVIVFAGLVALTAWGFVSLPTGFLPTEDQGYAFANIQLPDAASLERTTAVMKEVDTILANTPGVADRVSIAGFSMLTATNGSNLGMVAIVFEPWDERKDPSLSQEAILQHIRREFANIQEAMAIVFIPPPIDGLGNAGGFQMQVQDRGNVGLGVLQEMAEEIARRANAQQGLTAVSTPFRANVPQLYIDINRTKVMTLGIPLQSVFDTLQAYLGSTYVNDFNEFGRTWQVRVQAEPRFRVSPTDIEQLRVRNANGDMVPIGTFVTVEDSFGPQLIQRYQLYPSAQVNGEPAPGFSSGQALSLMEQVADATLPKNTMGYEWTGMAYQEEQVTGQQYWIFALAVVCVFLVLAFQYESWTNPAAVIAVVPMAALGVVIALWMRGADNDTYTQIGVVLLVALASKNAILIVEFARELRAGGTSVREAAAKAAELRFRAILMTALAAILGFLPLLVASGAGAASRQAVGNAVVGGMIAATFFSLLFVPSFFVLFQGLAEWFRPRPDVAQADDADSTKKQQS